MCLALELKILLGVGDGNVGVEASGLRNLFLAGRVLLFGLALEHDGAGSHVAVFEVVGAVQVSHSRPTARCTSG